VREGPIRYLADPWHGQKTGAFLDQRPARLRAGALLPPGGRGLDCFSYHGSFALHLAATAGEVVALDASAEALERAGRNATLNGFANLVTREGDAFEVLRSLGRARERFDVVVVDPPALIKRKKDLETGSAHYGALNKTAIELLAPEGVLVSCSCSHHLDADGLQRILLRESRTAGRRLQILEQGGQGPDHPVHPAIPETRYLKAFFCRVV
jgi:23S rRNA (cytosine1962-C5)-methyltransferase